MKLRQIKDFAELRIALPVIVKGCQVCGREHGGSLVEKTSRMVPISQDTIDWTACWIVTPRPQCAKEIGKAIGQDPEWVVTPVTVAQGRVFVEELDEPAADVRARKLEEVE